MIYTFLFYFISIQCNAKTPVVHKKYKCFIYIIIFLEILKIKEYENTVFDLNLHLNRRSKIMTEEQLFQEDMFTYSCQHLFFFCLE